MLGLPVSTEFNKRIPKQKFYENIAVTPAMKKAFVEQIKINPAKECSAKMKGLSANGVPRM